MSKQILIVILVIILVILLMPLKLQIIRNNEYDKKGKRKNDINLYFFNLLSLRFDLDEFINKISKVKEKNIYIILNQLKNNIKFIKKHKRYIKTFLKIVPVKKVTILYETKNPIIGVGCWNTIYIMKNIMNDLFENVNNEYYNVQMLDNVNTNIKFEFVCTIRVFYFIYAFIINIIKKLRKGSVFYGKPSNKRFISNFNG